MTLKFGVALILFLLSGVSFLITNFIKKGLGNRKYSDLSRSEKWSLQRGYSTTAMFLILAIWIVMSAGFSF